MKRVVDTSAWIEWLVDSALGRTLAPQIPPREELVVPTIVQRELAKWLLREIGEEKAESVVASTGKCLVVPLDSRIALLAADLHRAHQLATADAIVYATARVSGADLLTCDGHFDKLPDVFFVDKTTS